VAVTQAVDSDAVLEAAHVYMGVRSAAGSAVNTLATALAGKAGMAGTDNGAHAWASKYDPLVTNLMEASQGVVQGAGQCSDLLYATGINHMNADGESAINNETVLSMPPMGAPPFAKPSVPSAEGGHGDVPEWWHTISAYVEGELWPNGHQDQLRAAHDAWNAAARGLRSAAALVNGGTSSMGAIAPLMDQQSPEFPNLIKNVTLERDQIKAVADGYDAAAETCSSYAQTIDDAHSKILREMLELGATIAVTEIFAAVLIPFTAGASEAVSKVVDVARLTVAGSRIARIIREFRAAAELAGLPAVSAAGAAGRSMTELRGLLSARPTIFKAEIGGAGAGAGLSASEVANLSRESIKRKLETYLLNPDHAVGGPKAKWFEQALGFTRENSAALESQIVFDSTKAVPTGVTEFGQKYNQVIPIMGANGKTIDVTFAWIRNNDGVVRLVTAIPTKR
jgi:hypothetical protein